MAKLVIGNWKMNLALPAATQLARSASRVAEDYSSDRIVVAPPLIWLAPIREVSRVQPPNFALASQTVSPFDVGAHTGDVSAEQLKGLVTYCLVGHSERRRDHQERGAVIAAQIKRLVAQAITPVVCFGETAQGDGAAPQSQITADLADDLSGLSPSDLEPCVFAYEPVWAIGSGRPASPSYAAAVIAEVRQWLTRTYRWRGQVIYGGSVTADNASSLGAEAEIDGLLVGGASLHAREFALICRRFLRHV